MTSTSSGDVWLKFVNFTATFVTVPWRPETFSCDGYGFAAPLPGRVIMFAELWMEMFQPPEMVPALLPLSSTKNSLHVPFGSLPLRTPSVFPVGLPGGAGEGKPSS